MSQNPYSAFGIACQLGEGVQEWSAYSEAEAELLYRFSRALDRSGLAIPARNLEVRQKAMESQSGADTRPEIIPLLALAQHFGLPTKLLDWTRQSRVAAYFAAESAVKQPAQAWQDMNIAVWALRTTFIECLDRDVDSSQLRVWTAPASSNPNLHAQQGIFTRTEYENAHRNPVDAFVERAAEEAKTWELQPWKTKKGENPNLVERPLMRCFTLPRQDAPKLLRLLAYEGVTGATMFPGYDGVVRAMKEEALWDRPPTKEP